MGTQTKSKWNYKIQNELANEIEGEAWHFNKESVSAQGERGIHERMYGEIQGKSVRRLPAKAGDSPKLSVLRIID